MNETNQNNPTKQTPLNIWIFSLNVAGGCVLFVLNIIVFLEGKEFFIADIAMGTMLGVTIIFSLMKIPAIQQSLSKILLATSIGTGALAFISTGIVFDWDMSEELIYSFYTIIVANILVFPAGRLSQNNNKIDKILYIIFTGFFIAMCITYITLFNDIEFVVFMCVAALILPSISIALAVTREISKR
ncbi:MAG: hypothetical protein ACTSUE_11845 [Promethearchaeota archaeon]